LAIVASSLTDLQEKLLLARDAIGKTLETAADPRGIYWAANPQPQKVAFLFPGQGSQYPDMLAQVAMAFREVREVIDRAEATLAQDLEKPLGRFIYPPSPFTPEQEAANRDALRRTEVAQASIGATSLGMFRLLTALGIEPDFLAGHSYGEYTALAAAGAISEDDLMRLSYKRGRAIREAAKTAPGGMIAADASAEAIQPHLTGIANVWIANHNSPTQTVIAGTEDGVKQAAAALQAAGIRSQRIAVACGFHSPLIAGAQPALAQALAETQFTAPRRPVFANTHAAPHPADGPAIAQQLVEHLVSPVRFTDEILAMYQAGARVFVEVGPQTVLTGLTGQILAGRPHLAVATDSKSRPGLVQLTHTLAQLLTAGGVAANLDRLFADRIVEPFELTQLNADTGKPRLTPTTWVVNSVRSRPWNAPEPRLLGQALPANEVLAKSTVAAKSEPAAPTKPEPPAPPPPALREPANPVVGAVSPPAPPPTSRPVHASENPAPRPKEGQPRGGSPTLPSIVHNSPSRKMMHNTETPTASPAPTTHGSPPVTHAWPADTAAVMMRFHEVMARFLDTQKSVMLSFLGSSTHPPSPPSVNGHANYSAAPPMANGSVVPPPPLPLSTAFPATNRMAAVATSPIPPVATPAPVPAVAATSPSPHIVPPIAPTLPVEANGKHEPAANTVSDPAVPASPPATDTSAPAASEGEGVTPAKAAPVVLDRETLLARLLDLVSERTGYPKEALSIDLDLEADLGVDSIKRVEILGSLAESIEAGMPGRQPNLEMEKLSVIKTLRGIADYVMSALEEAAAPAPLDNDQHAQTQAAGTNGELHPGARQGEVQRLVVRLIDTPLPIRPTFAPPAGTIVITDDELGSARELADRLGELDIPTVIIGHGNGRDDRADLTDPVAVKELITRIRQQRGLISGLIHLLPLAEPPAGESDEQRTRREVKSLYLLARELENDLREAGQHGSAVLLAVTAMGGTMGFGSELPQEFFAGHGGVAGFTKCLGYEWPEVMVRVVDVSPNLPAPRLVEQLLGELGDPQGPLEVGRVGTRRVTWQVEPGPLEKSSPVVELSADDTILITGGARGITAKVALELATRYRPKLVLVGSSPLPAEESADTASLHSAAEIKAALLKRDPSAKPAAIEAAYKRLLKDREIRHNLAAIRAAGSVVEYHAIDVRDANALGALLDELKARGGISGVIHGAGVIEDKLLRDKTPESFERVFSTKVDSAFTLMRKLNPERLKFFTLYASITSRYGNRGQSDYAAANEVLSKLACDLDRRWPGRVVSMAWGPWAEVGMVADLEKHLVARGLKLIAPAVGAGFAVDEVIYGTKGEPEVLIAGGSETAARPVKVKSTAIPVTAE
jgi:malonyl CoA-acyl carrier protein transacylase/short-subunit dehydrogenase